MAQKKKVTATIIMEELLYDIMTETYLRGRTIQNDTNYKEVASMYASLDEENQDKILRSVKRAFSEVKTELADYLNEDGRTTDNKLISDTTNLVLGLLMPSNFNEAATAGIAEAVHDYLSSSAIFDWYLVTDKADAADYGQKKAASLESIRKCVSKRSRPMRRA